MASLRRVMPHRASTSAAAAAAAARAVLSKYGRLQDAAAVASAAKNRRSGTALAEARSARTACDVFLSHRGVDTKRSLAGLLYDRLAETGLRPFLDSRSMEPGDKLYECIDAGIRECNVGVAIFSPRYCDSVFCLHELAMLVESRKKLIPIFFDVKPSELRVTGDANAQSSAEELRRYARAIREAQHTVGLTFDSKTGNWSDAVSRTCRIVMKCMNTREK